MKKILAVFAIVYVTNVNAQTTRFEKTQGKETSDYFEVIDFIKKTDSKSTQIFLREMGETDAGFPLHLVLVSNDAKFDPAKWHQQQKVVILINNAIHPGEPDGVDASMILLRDIASKKIILPDNVALAIIPVYNIGGMLNRNSFTRVNQNGPAEYGFRGNSQNLDLNRDFTKNDSREALSFAKIFHYLNPDILIDNHVSDGADYQHTMTLITTQYEKLGNSLGSFLKGDFEPSIYKAMKKKGWDLIPYVEFGSKDFDKGINMFYDQPRYSSGYASLFNTMSFMPETHMLKPYADRVKSTLDLMKCFIEQGSALSKEIKSARKKATEESIENMIFSLSWKADRSVSDSFYFKGYKTEEVKSEATGLTRTIFDHNKPFDSYIRFFNFFKPVQSVTKPVAYVIPQGWHQVIDRLRANNIKLSTFKNDTTLKVTVYTITEFKSFPRPYEKHHKNYSVKVTDSPIEMKLSKGDLLVYTNQPGNKYIVEMLEPTGDDSFFAWNFFDGILQQKEGYSDYRWEELAADWLRKNPDLQKKLDVKRTLDSSFSNNSSAILEFIYKNSPYSEPTLNRYPIYRIENQ